MGSAKDSSPHADRSGDSVRPVSPTSSPPHRTSATPPQPFEPSVRRDTKVPSIIFFHNIRHPAEGPDSRT